MPARRRVRRDSVMANHFASVWDKHHPNLPPDFAVEDQLDDDEPYPLDYPTELSGDND